MTRYKCTRCSITYESDTGTCPECHMGDQANEMCPRDHCNCLHDVSDGIAYCPDCGAAMCPQCGSHDVAQISRVTGYLQDVEGWNAGKRQELKDRHRVNIVPEKQPS